MGDGNRTLGERSLCRASGGPAGQGKGSELGQRLQGQDGKGQLENATVNQTARCVVRPAAEVPRPDHMEGQSKSRSVFVIRVPKGIKKPHHYQKNQKTTPPPPGDS